MDPFGLESSEEVGEALEVFAGSCERGLRVLQEVAPGEVVLSTASTLPPCVSCDDFAATAAQRWPELPSSERRKLLQLRWRSAGPVSETEPQCVLDWPGGGSTASAPPPNARLRGVAACNGMAVAKLVLKPSLLKTLEAQPRHGLAVYPNGSLINHSCLPNVNRLPFQSCLVVRSSRRLMPGQEITSAYIEVRQPVFARHLELTSWDFTCGCSRCRLELHLAALGCDSAAEARRLWRRFERLRRTGACAEQDLQNLVDSAENHTRNLLKDFLAAQDPLPEDIAREFQRYEQCLQCGPADVDALDIARQQADEADAAGSALQAFFRLLLGSLWVGPAWELAFGLTAQARAEALHLWLAVREVTAEVAPLSPGHVAASMEAVFVAAEAADFTASNRTWRRLLQESLCACHGGYGPGTWLRLAAARLAQLEGSRRRELEQAVAEWEADPRKVLPARLEELD